MTGPRIVARLLIAAPVSADDGAAVADLLRPYAPTALHRLAGAATGDVEATLIAALGMPLMPVDGADPLQSIEAVAMRALGGCVAVLVPPDATSRLLARALGAPPEAGVRVAIVPRAVSVLECDDEGRWSVVRVNEGAYSLSEA